jgi:hypothetical protein
MYTCAICKKRKANKKCDVCQTYWVCDSAACMEFYDLTHSLECIGEQKRSTYVPISMKRAREFVDEESTTVGDPLVYDLVLDYGDALRPYVTGDGFYTYAELRNVFKLLTLSNYTYRNVNARALGKAHLDIGRIIHEIETLDNMHYIFKTFLAKMTDISSGTPSSTVRSLWRDMLEGSETLSLGFNGQRVYPEECAKLFQLLPNIRHVRCVDVSVSFYLSQLAIKMFPKLETFIAREIKSRIPMRQEPRITNRPMLKQVYFNLYPLYFELNLSSVLPETVERIDVNISIWEEHVRKVDTKSVRLNQKALNNMCSIDARLLEIYDDENETAVLDYHVPVSQRVLSVRYALTTQNMSDFETKLTRLKNLRVLLALGQQPTNLPHGEAAEDPDDGPVVPYNWINNRTPVYPSIEALDLVHYEHKELSSSSIVEMFRNIHRVFPNLRHLSIGLNELGHPLYELFGDKMPMFGKLKSLKIAAKLNSPVHPIEEEESIRRFCDACDVYCTAHLSHVNVMSSSLAPILRTKMCSDVRVAGVYDYNDVAHLPVTTVRTVLLRLDNDLPPCQTLKNLVVLMNFTQMEQQRPLQIAEKWPSLVNLEIKNESSDEIISVGFERMAMLLSTAAPNLRRFYYMTTETFAPRDDDKRRSLCETIQRVMPKLVFSRVADMYTVCAGSYTSTFREMGMPQPANVNLGIPRTYLHPSFADVGKVFYDCFGYPEEWLNFGIPLLW